MTKQIRPWSSILFLLISLFLVSCQGPGTPPGGTIKLGLLAALSGPRSETDGQPTQQGAELAIQQINEAGGVNINGRAYTLSLIVKDNEDTPQMSVTAAQSFINQEGIIALIGPQASRLAIPVSNLFEKAQIPMISPTSTNPQTTAGKRYIFRTTFIDSFQGQVMASFAYQTLGLRTTAVLYDVSDNYTRDIASFFHEAFEAEGGQVPIFAAYTPDVEDFFEPLTEVRDAEVDGLFLPNFTYDIIVQAQQARWLGIESTILGGDAWDLTTLDSYAELDGTYISHHWHPAFDSDISNDFERAYQAAYDQEPNSTAALTYDTVYLLAEALRFGQSLDPQQLNQALYDMPPYEGVSGTIDYINSGDPLKSVIITRIEQGEVFLETAVAP